MKEMTRLNGVGERVEIHGRCEPEDLERILHGAEAPAVVCDAEGHEEGLLDLSVVPSLRGAVLLVETHDFKRPGLTETLQSRFGETHRIERIWQENRSREDLPFRTLCTRLIPKSYVDLALSERRPERMSWLWMVPRR